MTSPNAPRLGLRPAGHDDCELYFAWANDRVTRENSFSPAPIPWEEHVSWFEAALVDESRILLVIVKEDGTLVGQVRFDREGDGAAEISISIAAGHRGRKMSVEAIRLGTSHVAAQHDVSTVYAHIRLHNGISIRAFTQAGFANLGTVSHRGTAARRMTWSPATG